MTVESVTLNPINGENGIKKSLTSEGECRIFQRQIVGSLNVADIKNAGFRYGAASCPPNSGGLSRLAIDRPKEDTNLDAGTAKQSLSTDAQAVSE